MPVNKCDDNAKPKSNCTLPTPVEVIEIEDVEEQPIIAARKLAAISDVDAPNARKTISATILGKRVKAEKSIDEQWIDLLGDDQDDFSSSDLLTGSP